MDSARGGQRDGKRSLARAAALAALCSLPFPAGDATAKDWEEKSIPEKHVTISQTVQKAADAIDSFFASDRELSWEENKTTITLRFDTDLIEYHGAEFNPTLKLRLNLPRLKQLSFVVNEDTDQASEYTAAGSDEDSSLALRWTGRAREGRDLSLDAGVRLRKGDSAVFGRLNAAVEYDLGAGWLGRSANRLYWYTNTGWRDDLRQYFERQLGEDFLFRSRTRVQYFEEHGTRLYPEQKFTVYQRLKGHPGILAYELVGWTVAGEDTVFDDDEIEKPDSDYSRVLALVRYRRNVMWPWLFVEFWPGLGFAEELDYRATLYLRFRVDIQYGHFFEKAGTIIEE